MSRTQRGTMLAITVALIFVLTIIAVGIFSLIKLFGGARELQALTDSGALNIGKSIIKIGVPLSSTPQLVNEQIAHPEWWGLSNQIVPVSIPRGLEATHFSYLVDANGNITLENYNRIIAQTMLVGLNAKAEGTMESAANAQILYSAVQRDSSSISARLATKLADPTVASQMFMNTAILNSLRMLGLSAAPNFVSSKFAGAYYSAGNATNVWVDASMLPANLTLPAGALVSGPGNHSYLTGYTNLDAGPITIQGTPVFPGSQPHLISLRDFSASTTSPLDIGYVAQNSFLSTAATTSNIDPNSMSIDSASVVGILSTTYAASIPEGYLVITNVDGLQGTLPQVLTYTQPQGATVIMNAMAQRIHEIVPTMTDTQIRNFLNAVYVNPDPNKPTYIYLYPDPSSPGYAAWHAQLVASGSADGTPGQMFFSTVKPPTYPGDLMNNTYGVWPDGTAQTYPMNGSTTCTFSWLSSSGFNNFLGALDIP